MSTSTAELPVARSDRGEESLHEIVGGRWVEKVMGIRQIWLANRLSYFINQFSYPSGLGVAIVEQIFDLGTTPARQYRPDLAFIAQARWSQERIPPEGAAWSLVPDLAVEVVSPSNSADEIEAKVLSYFEAGVRLVWVIYMGTSRVHVWESPISIRVVPLDGALVGGEVLPGFALPLVLLFGAADDPS